MLIVDNPLKQYGLCKYFNYFMLYMRILLTKKSIIDIRTMVSKFIHFVCMFLFISNENDKGSI